MTIKQAAQLYLDRQSRKIHPQGDTDNAGRWYPHPYEIRECCQSIRAPSRDFPWSLMAHCRTLKHIAMYAKKDITKLRKEICRLES